MIKQHLRVLGLTSPLSGVNLLGSLMTRLWRAWEMGVVSCGSTSISSSSSLGSHSEHCLLTQDTYHSHGLERKYLCRGFGQSSCTVFVSLDIALFRRATRKSRKTRKLTCDQLCSYWNCDSVTDAEHTQISGP